MKKQNTLYLVQGAAIAAIYVVITVMFAPLSFGNVQIRFSEALTVLPFFTPDRSFCALLRIWHESSHSFYDAYSGNRGNRFLRCSGHDHPSCSGTVRKCDLPQCCGINRTPFTH